MLGCYDFCGHYDWTFAWLQRNGGKVLVRRYWEEAISHDSQLHARDLILAEGFAGMAKYWGHTLAEESPDHAYTLTRSPDVFRIDMHDCPSKGFLLRNGIENHCDYCDHCIGWIGPVMGDAGFVIDHEHNHRGQCWWEFRAAGNENPGDARPGALPHDVRNAPNWNTGETPIDRYLRATSPEDKV
jgi:hypothetical protein